MARKTNHTHPRTMQGDDTGEVDARLDDSEAVGLRPKHNPHHCETCGVKANEYFRVDGFTVCEACVQPWERDLLEEGPGARGRKRT